MLIHWNQKYPYSAQDYLNKRKNTISGMSADGYPLTNDADVFAVNCMWDIYRVKYSDISSNNKYFWHLYTRFAGVLRTTC